MTQKMIGYLVLRILKRYNLLKGIFGKAILEDAVEVQVILLDTLNNFNSSTRPRKTKRKKNH